MEKYNKINVYLASDSSGETALHVANAVLSQFHDLHVNKFMWPMMRTKTQMDNLVNIMKIKPGILLYTIVDHEIEQYLLEECDKNNLPAISLLTHVIDTISTLFNFQKLRNKPGVQHKVHDEHYLTRIAAIDYTLAHDDGQKLRDAYGADIILLGVSRTSKSPTSLYLAQRGFKTSNIPLIGGVNIHLDFKKLDKTLVVGLTINAEKLKNIRSSRLTNLTTKAHHVNNYTDLDTIRAEIIEARKFFENHNIPVIDVSNKAVEETAAEIINMYYAKFDIMAHMV